MRMAKSTDESVACQSYGGEVLDLNDARIHDALIGSGSAPGSDED